MSLEPVVKRHLAAAFAELLAYGVSFRQSIVEKQTAYEQVRADVLRLLKQSESITAQGLSTPEDYDQARYAVCAWMDECVLASAWNAKARWRPELLQRIYYQSADAGEKFFQRLKNLEPHEQEIREVYYLCLALGFRGRYCDPDDQYALDQLKERHLKLLFNSVSDAPTLASLEKNILFPEAYAPQAPSTRAKKIRRAWSGITVLAVPVAAFAALFLIYRFTLYSIGENILKAVRS